MTILVIVESPNKIKKVRSYLETIRPNDKFVVKASVGHIRDLPIKHIGIDVNDNFGAKWEIMQGKHNVVSDLEKTAKYASTILLACDPDREGEAIAFHLQELLNISIDTPCRMVYQSITKDAIEEALSNIKPIDQQLVEAAICRRKLDRLMGYLVSQVLWSGVSGAKSAGRTQSVVLLLLVMKEQEIAEHKDATTYKLIGNFQTKGNEPLDGTWFESLESINNCRTLMENIKMAEFRITNKKSKTYERHPPPPFITSTLQQAGRAFGLSVKEVQAIAQDLYSNGHITYIRTDLAEIAPSFIPEIKSFIENEYGEEYVATNPKKKKSKAGTSQEGHEAIRVCKLDFLGDGLAVKHKKVYELIWKRTVACLMSPQQLEKFTIHIIPSTTEGYFHGEQINELFDGFTKVTEVFFIFIINGRIRY